MNIEDDFFRPPTGLEPQIIHVTGIDGVERPHAWDAATASWRPIAIPLAEGGRVFVVTRRILAGEVVAIRFGTCGCGLFSPTLDEDYYDLVGVAVRQFEDGDRIVFNASNEPNSQWFTEDGRVAFVQRCGPGVMMVVASEELRPLVMGDTVTIAPLPPSAPEMDYVEQRRMMLYSVLKGNVLRSLALGGESVSHDSECDAPTII